MKTYYCVTTEFYDDGRVTAAITATLEADTQPENTFKNLRDKDVYNDWFADKADAEAFVEEALHA